MKHNRDFALRSICRTSPDLSKWEADNRGRRQEKSAPDACYGCPVMPECAAYALEGENRGMIWAGVPVPADRNSGDYETAINQLKLIAGT